MEKMWQDDINREMVEQVRRRIIWVTKGAIQECGGSEFEVQLPGSTHRCQLDDEVSEMQRQAYIGVVILLLRSSSARLRIPSGLKKDSRENKTSVGMCRREFVAAKIFCSSPPFLIGRLRKKKTQIEQKSTFKPRDVSSGSGLVGGRVRIAVLRVR